jgi:hypothetical protein
LIKRDSNFTRGALLDFHFHGLSEDGTIHHRTAVFHYMLYLQALVKNFLLFLIAALILCWVSDAQFHGKLEEISADSALLLACTIRVEF